MDNFPDFKKGVEICKNNSERLTTSGWLIINNEDGTYSFGVFLFYIAYEEIVKAVFCFFVFKGWVEYEYIQDVFLKHEAKAFLFEEFLSSFEIKDGIAYLGGKILGEIPLIDFMKKYKSNIKQHRDDTMNFLYVDYDNGEWHIPHESIIDIKEKKEQIINKITAMRALLRTLEENSDRSLLNNFKIIINSGGFIQIQFDAI